MSWGVSSDARTPKNYGGPIVPSDTVNFPDEISGIWVGGAGAVALVRRDNTAVLFSGCQAGQIIYFPCIRVNATGTTATLMNWLA